MLYATISESTDLVCRYFYVKLKTKGLYDRLLLYVIGYYNKNTI